MQFKLPTHQKNSYKGHAGKVLIVGGSEEYYGAPILAALGAENSGADLITLFLPSEHVQTAKNYSLNLFLKKFKNSFLSKDNVPHILKEALNHHALIIGNGIGKNKKTVEAVLKILESITIPVIIDAEALIPEILKTKNQNKSFILTPHKKEFERVFDCVALHNNVKQQAVRHSMTILLKGSTDIIASFDGKAHKNETGCSEMKVGGTGDVLAGIVGSFISQGLDPYMACCSAAYYFGKCGEALVKNTRYISAYDLASAFGKAIKN
jgi:hydroxyethylthiazole kinase-like uncharacterized protein yjeF